MFLSVYFLALVIRLGVSVVKERFILVVLVCFLRVANKVGSIRYCEYAHLANMERVPNKSL